MVYQIYIIVFNCEFLSDCVTSNTIFQRDVVLIVSEVVVGACAGHNSRRVGRER